MANNTKKKLHEVRLGMQGMTALVYYEFEQWCRLVFVSNFLHGSGLPLLEDEQKFKLGACVGTHKTSISHANILSICIK
jgi:hypothetical protein